MKKKDKMMKKNSKEKHTISLEFLPSSCKEKKLLFLKKLLNNRYNYQHHYKILKSF